MKKLSLALALVAAVSFGCGSATETSAPTGTDTDGGSTPTPTTDAGISPTPAVDAGTTPTPAVDAGTTPTPTADAGATACTTKTYANFGQSFFAAKCNGCHSVQSPRFTTASAITSNIALCKAEITAGTMPIGAPLSAQEKSSVMEWLNCGAP
jgi:hypothetical protein